MIRQGVGQSDIVDEDDSGKSLYTDTPNRKTKLAVRRTGTWSMLKREGRTWRFAGHSLLYWARHYS